MDKILYKKNIIFSGGVAIKKFKILNDKRHILTQDTKNSVAVYDVLKASKSEDLGIIDFENEALQRNQHHKTNISEWFDVELVTGVCI